MISNDQGTGQNNVNPSVLESLADAGIINYGTTLASPSVPIPGTMKKILLITALAVSTFMGHAQFQINPQLGVNYQHLTSPSANTNYKAAMGWMVGLDLRFGDRAYIQPGAFLGRGATVVQHQFSDTLTIEDDLVRTSLKLRTMVGYRIVDSYQFDLRFAIGPSYDVLMSVDDRQGNISWDKADFSKGSWNIDAALGFDMGLVSVEPSVSFGLSKVFNENLAVSDIGSKYLTYGLTVGFIIGNDDK